MNGNRTERRPGMMDVAKAAGVSHQTVSRVLNDHPSVRPETRDRVREAITTLGYRRNLAARALVRRQSDTIGVLTTASNLVGPVATLLALEEEARARGLFVSPVGLRSGDRPEHALNHLMDQDVDAIVVIAPQRHVADAIAGVASKVPLVMVSSSTDAAGSGAYCTSVDQHRGAVLATRHLIDTGHQTIAHVAGPEDWFDATAREAAYRQELVAAGLPVGPVLMGDWSADSGYAAGQQLLADGLPDAVFVANDVMAVGLIRAFTEAGIVVPQQVSVIGFDDVEGAAYLNPPLTTVRQPFAELGKRCMELVVQALSGVVSDPSPIAPELVVRASTRQRVDG